MGALDQNKTRGQKPKKIKFNVLLAQLLVRCGGGLRPADGLRKQHVRTI